MTARPVFFYLFIFQKGKGPTRKCAHLRNVLSVTVRNKIFVFTLVKEIIFFILFII